MGERCFLKVHDQPEPIGPESEKNYAIGMAYEVASDDTPLLWLAMFREQDIKEIDTRENYHDEDAPVITLPILHTSIASALATLRARVPALQRHTHEKLWPYIDLFIEALDQCGCKYIQYDLFALWWHTGEGESEHFIDFIKKGLNGFESDEAFVSIFGDRPLTDTIELYGLKFLDLFGLPLGGEIDLPWCHVDEDGAVVPSSPQRDRIMIGDTPVRITDDNPLSKYKVDDYFVLSHDTDEETAARFGRTFVNVWNGMELDAKEKLLDIWHETAMIAVPNSAENAKSKQYVFVDGRPFLALMKNFPHLKNISMDTNGGRALFWHADLVASMDDETLATFIGENLACAYLHVAGLTDNMTTGEYPDFVKKVAHVDVALVQKWLATNL